MKEYGTWRKGKSCEASQEVLKPNDGVVHSEKGSDMRTAREAERELSCCSEGSAVTEGLRWS